MRSPPSHHLKRASPEQKNKILGCWECGCSFTKYSCLGNTWHPPASLCCKALIFQLIVIPDKQHVKASWLAHLNFWDYPKQSVKVDTASCDPPTAPVLSLLLLHRLQHFEAAHQGVIDRHHGAGIVKLATCAVDLLASLIPLSRGIKQSPLKCA